MQTDHVVAALAVHAIVAQVLLVSVTLTTALYSRKRLKTKFGPTLLISVGFSLMVLKRVLSYLVAEGYPQLAKMSEGVVPLLVSLTLLLGVSLLLREIVRSETDRD